jgi:hypothetical protein
VGLGVGAGVGVGASVGAAVGSGVCAGVAVGVVVGAVVGAALAAGVGEAVGAAVGLAEGVGDGIAVGLGVGLAVGAADGVAVGDRVCGVDAEAAGTTGAFAESTNVPVPPSDVVSVSSSPAITHVVTVPRACAKRLPYDPSGQATSVLAPGVRVRPSLRWSV